MVNCDSKSWKDDQRFSGGAVLIKLCHYKVNAIRAEETFKSKVYLFTNDHVRTTDKEIIIEI